MSRVADLALTGLLLLGVGLAGWRALQGAGQGATALVLLDPVDARLEAAAVGEVLTVEDLARVSLDAELPADRAQALAPRVAEARAHRDALLASEEELRRAEDELDAAAREVLALLDPAQRQWVLDQRDRVSVGEVEAATWEELARRLEAAP